jgi:hypothetical protein
VLNVPLIVKGTLTKAPAQNGEPEIEEVEMLFTLFTTTLTVSLLLHPPLLTVKI